MRARRVPDGRLSGLLLDRELLGYQHSRAQFASWLEPPRPQLTLMIDLDGGLTANGERLPDAWIGGLDDRPTIVGFGGTYGAIDLKLTPLGAYTLAGLPLHELARACVPLRDVFGPEGDELVARLRALDDWDERFDVLEAFLLRRLYRTPAAPAPDPAVAWAFEQLRRTRGAARVEALAAELGCSRRYLRDGFVRQVGLPPKTVGRLMRFQHVRERIQEAPGALERGGLRCRLCRPVASQPRVPGAGGHNAERLRAAAHPRRRRHRRPLPLIQDRGSATG